MSKWLRWLFWLAVISGAGFAVWTALQRRNEPAPSAPPPRPTPKPAPPIPESAAAPAVDEPSPSEPISAPVDVAPSDGAQRWRAPVDGACPDGFPIKVAKSGIYHVPGGRSYERTVAHRCYASADDAEADGYRRAKA